MIGAVLAGGRGLRMGGEGKATAELAGRPLLERPLRSLLAVCARVAVVCKPGTALPALPAEVERWDEPESPRHPAVGIAHAVQRAEGPVLVCAADMPFVTAEACELLVRAHEERPGAPAVIARAGGRLQPVLGIYTPAAAGSLAQPGDLPLTRLAEALEPVLVELAADVVRSVNTPEELAAAEREVRVSASAGARRARR